MAITQINDPFARGGGNVVGSQFGQTLADNLNNLAVAKSQQLAQHKLSNVFNQLGLPGNQLGQLPEQDRQLVLKELLGEYGVGAPSGQDQLMQLLMGQQQQPNMMGQQGQQLPTMGMRLGSRALKRQHELGKEERSQLHTLEKAERPYYDKTVQEYDSSKATLNDLDRLTNLINKGTVVNPTEDHIQRWLSGLFKVNLKDLRGADTEEFEKIVSGFIKNAKSMFGSRVTDYDLQSFMKTLPTLATSHEGKMRLIGSMKAAAEAQQLKYKALKSLIKANGGRIPPYAGLMVDEMIQPELDDLSKRFISGDIAPALSPEAKKASNRNWYLRPLKVLGGLVPSKAQVAGGIVGSAIPGIGPVGGGIVGSALEGLLKHSGGGEEF